MLKLLLFSIVFFFSGGLLFPAKAQFSLGIDVEPISLNKETSLEIYGGGGGANWNSYSSSRRSYTQNNLAIFNTNVRANYVKSVFSFYGSLGYHYQSDSIVKSQRSTSGNLSGPTSSSGVRGEATVKAHFLKLGMGVRIRYGKGGFIFTDVGISGINRLYTNTQGSETHYDDSMSTTKSFVIEYYEEHSGSKTRFEFTQGLSVPNVRRGSIDFSFGIRAIKSLWFSKTKKISGGGPDVGYIPVAPMFILKVGYTFAPFRSKNQGV